MLTILRVRGASCRDIDDLTTVKDRFTTCVALPVCSWLTSIFRKVIAGVVTSLEGTTNALPCHRFSPRFRPAAVLPRAAHRVRAERSTNERGKANSQSHRRIRFLWNADRLSIHCPTAHRLAAAKHERNAGRAAASEPGGRRRLLHELPTGAGIAAQGVGCQRQV